MAEIDDLWKDFVETGDMVLFRLFYDRYWKRLLGVAINILKEQSESEDVVQDVFISLWERREKVGIENLEAYLYNAVKYGVYRRLSQSKAANEILIKLESIKFANNVEEKLSYDEAWKSLDDCISNLPEKPRLIFMMSRFENLSNEEISNKLRISKKTVEGHMTQALKRLRKCHSDTA